MLTNQELYDVGLAPDQKLLDFQLEDVDFMRELKSVLVGNEMGTGKTYEAIARDLLLRHDTDRPGLFRTLVVAPLSVLPSWREHFKTLAPKLRVRMIDRKNRHTLLDEIADVYIVHWDVLRLMPELKNKAIWDHCIADECHRMKNRKAKQTRALKNIRVRNKTAMSGTPMVNRADELWSVLDWLHRGQFGGYWQFYKRFVDYEIIYPQGFHKVLGVKNSQRLRGLMEDFYVRRLKKDVLHDLPDKYYTSYWVDLGPKQRKAYDSMRKDMLAWIGKNEDQPLAAPVVIARLIRLQQLALAYGNIEIGLEGGTYYPELPSAKIEMLLDIMDDLGDKQLVIFSQFSKMVNLTEGVLKKKGYSTVKLTGSVSHEGREAAITNFQAGRAQVFLATIGAGGVGITLTAASTAVFLDRDWSPANNLQAEDRLHRHGQLEPVQIIDLMARNTVDLGRKQKLEQKWTWVRSILDGN